MSPLWKLSPGEEREEVDALLTAEETFGKQSSRWLSKKKKKKKRDF